jgi:hypothetical protein
MSKYDIVLHHVNLTMLEHKAPLFNWLLFLLHFLCISNAVNQLHVFLYKASIFKVV